MATGTLQVSSVTNVTTIALNSLASATYVVAGTIDVSAIDPIDVLLEVAITPGTPTNNKQAVIFAQLSLDNTNFTTGPSSGSTSTDEPNLKLIGVLPLASTSVQQRGIFSVVEALGFIPPYIKIIIKNDTSATLAASGHSVDYATVTASIA